MKVGCNRSLASAEKACQLNEWPALSGLSPQVCSAHPFPLSFSHLPERTLPSQTSVTASRVSTNPSRPCLVPHFSVFPTFTFGNRLLKPSCLSASQYPFFCLLLVFSTHVVCVRDLCPHCSHRLCPTSSPSNPLTAPCALLPCLRPPFSSCPSGQDPVSSAGLPVQEAAPP